MKSQTRTHSLTCECQAASELNENLQTAVNPQPTSADPGTRTGSGGSASPGKGVKLCPCVPPGQAGAEGSNHGRGSPSLPSLSSAFVVALRLLWSLGGVEKFPSSAHILPVPACLLAGLEPAGEAFPKAILCCRTESRNKVGLKVPQRHMEGKKNSFPLLSFFS